MAAEEVHRNTFKHRQSLWAKILRQDLERNFQIQLRRDAMAGNHVLQMKEKSLLKEQEKQEGKKDLGMLIHLDELHAQELRRQEEQKPLLMKLERENRLEDISRVNSYKEEQAEMLLTEEERTRLAQIEIEGNLLKRKNDVMDKYMRHRLFAQAVCDKLVAIQKQQAAATAEREERSLASGLAKIQAEEDKLQKDAEEKAEALQSIAAHRQNMIQERQRREEAERQRSADWLQAQREADGLYLEDNELNAEWARKEKVNSSYVNNSLDANKGQSQIQRKLTGLDHRAASHTLGRGLSLSCGKGSNRISADITGAPSIRAIKKKDSQSCNWARKLINRPKVVTINHNVENSQPDNENQVIAELRMAKQKMDEADNRRKTAKVVLSKCDLQQMRERALQKGQAERQSKKNLELRRNMDRLHAQDLRWQEKQKHLLKKVERKNCLEDIPRKKSDRKEQAEILKAEKEQTKLACVELEGKPGQRKVDSAARIRRRSSEKSECENLASLKKEEAAVTGEKEEQSTFTGLARRRDEQVKQQKEKAERNAEGSTLGGEVSLASVKRTAVPPRCSCDPDNPFQKR